jgi:methyltransferase (TIGR00027 family)
MPDEQTVAPEDTAARAALWRALHVEVDDPPHVFEDEVGLELLAPAEGWRRPELASRLLVFEIDRPGPQAWKRQRLVDLGRGVPSFLRLVPVDFEAGDAWREGLVASGFDSDRPAAVASTGVTMYLSKEAIVATLRQVAALAPGSTLAMTFMLPIEMADPEVRRGIERAVAGAKANGTPFVSLFTPTEMLALARDAGFKEAEHMSAAALGERYFAGRKDGLRPLKNSEELLVAKT